MVEGEAIPCSICECYVYPPGHGPEVLEFNYGDYIYCYLHWGPDSHNFDGEWIRYRWYHNGTKIRELTTLVVGENYGKAYCACPEYWGYDPKENPIPPGTGYVQMYWRKLITDPWTLVATSNTYTILEPQGETTGAILPSSVFYTGPFNPGQNVLLMALNIQNSGNLAGTVYARVYQNPGTGEQAIGNYSVYLNPGATGQWKFYYTIPNAPGMWQLGVKVWGVTEAEPPW